MLVKQDETQLKEGYLMRPVRFSDAEAIVGLCNYFSRALNALDELTVSEIEAFWQTPRLSMEDDLRVVFTPQDKYVGYIESLTLGEIPAHAFIWFRLHPDYTHEGVGEALFDWALQRASRVMDLVPEGLRISIACLNAHGFGYGHRLYESRGFKVIRHSYQMHIDLDKPFDSPEWPAGITLRHFDAGRDAENVYRSVDEAFSDHFGHVEEPFESGYPRWRQMMVEDKEAFDPSLWFVAVHGDEIAGISLCRLMPQEGGKIGWVSQLGVRRPWRKRGLGKALLLHSFAEFARRRLHKAGLGVDASNLTGALRLYERAGMYVAQQYDRYEKELRPGKELMTTEVSA
ncbi:MAG: GNAT family N-acetyltransferase [Anaerolineales bacterium]